MYAPPGTPWDIQVAGDCKQTICDGAGNVTNQNDGTDPLDDQNECTMDHCTEGQPENVPLAAGVACGPNGGEVCDGNGACVECTSPSECASNVCAQNKCVPASCADGMKNGSETDEDCGVECATCADGATCVADSDCTSGVCKMGICAEPGCSDGVKNGAETDEDCGGTCNPCADGSICKIGLDCMSGVCAANLCQPPICGDGVKNGGDGCDDGNIDAGDGCSSTCVIEPGYRCAGIPSICLATPIHAETEGNDLCDSANGPFPAPFIYTGELAAFIDEDFVAFTLTTHADVQIEIRSTPTGACSSLGPPISLIGSDCSILLAPEIPGFLSCPGITPFNAEGARDLAPGTYYVHVEHPWLWIDQTWPIGYVVEISLTAFCGDGIREGDEECDDGGPSPTCDATCQRVPTCGDGFWDAPEACDDGNQADGDCCSSTCQIEAGLACLPVDIEPNDACGQANGPFLLPAIVDTPLVYTGAINTSHDVDYIAFTVPGHADVKLETFDPVVGQCVEADTTISLFDSNCKEVAQDDDDGLKSCSRIAPPTDFGGTHLAPGPVYYASVKHYNEGIVPHYQLAISMSALCGNGIREGSEICDGSPNCNADCTAPLVCGDGLLHPDEGCDDHNATSGDGCSSMCTLEPNYQCSGSPSVCISIETNCGNGLDDDGDGQADGADENCQLPAYFKACAAAQTLHVFKSSPALGLAIPEFNPKGTSHSLAVPNIGSVARAAMLLNISHTGDQDIDLWLKPPGVASPIDVCSDNGDFGNDFANTLIDTACATSIWAGSAPFTGCFMPENPFSTASAEGLWTITATDDDINDQGTLDNWAMIFCTTP